MESHSISTIVDIEPSQYRINCDAITALASTVCLGLGVPAWELCIRIVDSKEIHDLNKTFRGIDRPTDVLSFPQSEWHKPLEFVPKRVIEKADQDNIPPRVLGDIAICIDVASENARNIGQTVARETCFLIVHGLLHLSGHDHEHESDEVAMVEQQRQIMAFLECSPHWATWSKCVEITEDVNA